MNDLQTLRDVFDRAGIVYKVMPRRVREPGSPDAQPRYVDSPDGAQRIEITEGEGPKNKGYSGFITVMEFTADGSLDTVGAWE